MTKKQEIIASAKVWLWMMYMPLFSFGQAQDVLYTKQEGKTEGTIKSVNDLHILFENNTKINLASLVMGIKANGDILMPSEQGNGYRWIINEDPQYHKIITLNHEVFAAEKVENINKNKICFHDYFNGRYFVLDASEVGVILYKNGMHELVAAPDIARKCLEKIKDLKTYASRKPPSTIELSAEEQDYFSRRALKKTQAFSVYLSILSDSKADELDQDDAVKQAIRLFIDEERLVEVSSLNSDTARHYKIGQYLNHIRMLPYARVEILWNQIAYINQIKRGVDGNYYGLITVEQIFRGFNEENLVVYEDLTQKNLQVVVKPYSQVIEGKEIKKWDVFLSDIGVQNTSSL
jgi:hypothetical protein